MARLRREPTVAAQLSPAPSKTRQCSSHDSDHRERIAKTKMQQRRRRVIESDESNAENSDMPCRQAARSHLQKNVQLRLVPLQSLASTSSLSFNLDEEVRSMKSLRTPSTRAKAGRPVSSRIAKPRSMSKTIPKEAEDTEEMDIEESIWSGSTDDPGSSADEERELPSLRKISHLPRRPVEKDVMRPAANVAQDVTKQFQALRMSADDDDDNQYIFSKKPRPATMRKPQKPQCSSEEENDAPGPHLPRLSTGATHRHKPDRSSTPPPPPSPGKLRSPSKRNVRSIPTLAPMRPSIDAFWTADAVNDWNDQYSPQNPLKSPRKPKLIPESADASPSTSPAKCNSPTKRTKAELELRQNFETRKHRLAESFLTELDSTVTAGRIADLAASTGGVRLIWSKTLNTTAGRANWRRESTKFQSRSGGTTSTTVVHKHYASIELASKVIDDEHRLLDVLAHEFCHLANFMVSGIKDQPHGASFKEWGRKCTAAFGDRGVKVTTKHAYEIEYKYIWQCADEECGVEFGRHSRSIDPARHKCGACKRDLVQIKPVPRKNTAVVAGKSIDSFNDGSTAETPGANRYAAYVKLHFANLRKSMPSAAHKEVMEALGKKYRAEKAAKKSKMDLESLVDEVARDLEIVNLVDVRERKVIELD